MSSRIKKLNQLDSFRAMAAFMVIAYHFLPDLGLGSFSIGWIGVDIFFMISGYLITAILLEQKEAVTNKLLIIKNFVIKRALRLFPAYYLYVTFLLVLMYFFGLYSWDPGDEIYYYTYTQNILFFIEGKKGIQANHLWTLAVEEQFYLFWPWLVLFISNTRLIKGLLVLIPLSLFLKSFIHVEELRMLTTSHFDTLGAGALFALLLKQGKEQYINWINDMRTPIISISILVFIIRSIHGIPSIIMGTAILSLSLALIAGSYYGYTGHIGRILDLKILIYFGKISYGLYLYHRPMPYFFKLLQGRFNFELDPYWALALAISFTFLIAHLSYMVMESRFLRLKDRFDL